MSKWFDELDKIEGAVKQDAPSPHLDVLRSPSPSLNYIFGNGHGLPYGYSAIFYGVPKGGKSIICNAYIGQLHKDDPDAKAIKFNTEMREEGQSSDIWGIDKKRYKALNVNRPALIFDTIERMVPDMIQHGDKVKLIIIDSIQGIQGRMGLNAESVEDLRPGDKAYTVQAGLERILPIIRQHKIALIMTQHIRANLDMGFAHGPKTKMAGAWGLKHAAEYHIGVNPNKSPEGSKDWLGAPLQDPVTKYQAGKRIQVWMDSSSVGEDNREGEFILDFHRGIVDTYGEIVQIADKSKVIFHPKSKSGTGTDNSRWQFEDTVWHGYDNMVKAVKEDLDLQARILQEIRKRDIAPWLPKKE